MARGPRKRDEEKSGDAGRNDKLDGDCTTGCCFQVERFGRRCIRQVQPTKFCLSDPFLQWAPYFLPLRYLQARCAMFFVLGLASALLLLFSQ